MSAADHRHLGQGGGGGGGGVRLWGFCLTWNSGATRSASTLSTQALHRPHLTTESVSSSRRQAEGVASRSSSSITVSSVARSLLPPKRRLRFDPATNLYFPYEPGKQVRSAVRIKNRSGRSHVAFKFQTTAPKSCYMRPSGGILAPGESLTATVFKFVEQPEKGEKQLDRKSKVKFRIMSLKVNQGTDYVPELFDEQKDQVVLERVLRVVFLNTERPTAAFEKLKRQLAEAEAEQEARKKPPMDTGLPVVGEGLVIDEWKERREKYLAQQQVEPVVS